MSSPIMVAYYGQFQSFTYQHLQDGTFDAWMTQTYTNFKGVNPCQGLVTTTTTTTSTNLVSNTLNLVMNLNTITNLDFSSLGRGLGTDIAGSTSSGSGSLKKDEKKGKGEESGSSGENSKPSPGNPSNSNQENPSQGSNGNPEGNVGSNNSGSSGGSVGSNSPGSSGGTDQSGSSGNNGSGSSANGGSTGNNGSGSSGGNGSSDPLKKEDQPSQEKIDQTKEDQQKATAGSISKATDKAKTNVQKPAILVTGDIVGVQSASVSKDQDARGTFSFTRVKGDGTSSISISADYMFNAKIGNVTLVKSWIGTNSKGHKHINVLSDGFSLMPGTLSNTLLFVRVNSLKNFTALYGGAASYGKMYGQELISTIAIGGFMYKGKLTKKIDATIIAAGIYPPYTKYYTESIFESKPFIIPFLNLNYKMTKTFGVGLTGGGTYIAGQNVLNYQVLLGAKLIL